ncbi:MAG: phage portal protein, partial [Proteobacteria bacterium]|nr:phage portal protein [Pseudomonadota bacterium]
MTSAAAIEVATLYTANVPIDEEQDDPREHAYSMALAQVLLRVSGSTLVNDAEPGGILTADGAPDPAVIDSIREQWRSRHEGIDNKRRIAVLSGGLKWQQLSA